MYFDAVAPATHLVSNPPSSVHAAAKLLLAVTLTGGLLGLLLLLAVHACMLAGMVLCGLAVCMCVNRAFCVCFIGTGHWR